MAEGAEKVQGVSNAGHRDLAVVSYGSVGGSCAVSMGSCRVAIVHTAYSVLLAGTCTVLHITLPGTRLVRSHASRKRAV